MKDTIIKETGNSRFLRSSVAEDITFAEFIALLRAGQLPIDLAGINEEGIETLGMALSKGNLLNEETEMTIWGDVGDRTPTNALKKIYEIFSAGLAEKAKIVAGTYSGSGLTSGKTISLGFAPIAVIIANDTYEEVYVTATGYRHARITLTSTGFKVVTLSGDGSISGPNGSGTRQYIAMG